MKVTHVCFSQWRMACLNMALWLPETHTFHILLLHNHTSVCILLLRSTGSSPVELLTSEVSSYDVGYYSSRPYPLSSGCSRSWNTALYDVPSLPTFPSLALGTGSSLAGVLGEIVYQREERETTVISTFTASSFGPCYVCLNRIN